MARGVEERVNTEQPVLPGEILGRRSMRGHITVRHRGTGLSYCGLYEDPREAEEARKTWARNMAHKVIETSRDLGFIAWPFMMMEAVENWVAWRRETKVVELRENESFIPWGTGGKTFIHGVDDWTHGHFNEEQERKFGRMLRPHTR